MDMKIFFPGGKRVFADYKGFVIETDQSVKAGGKSSAPQPFDLFMVSLGTCAGIFALEFCRKRNLDTEGLGITQTMKRDEKTGLISDLILDIALPKNFPEKYRSAIARSAELCTVKRNIEDPPRFEIVTTPK